MPEGHVIHRLANELTSTFGGQQVRVSSPQGRFPEASLIDGTTLTHAEAIGKQQLSLEQALDLPEDLLGEIQEAFLDGEGELPPVGDVAPLFAGRVPEQVLYCVRAALQAEFEA